MSSLLAYNERRVANAVLHRTGDGANRSPRALRRLRPRAALARTRRGMLRGLLDVVAEDQGPGLYLLCAAIARRGGVLPRVPGRSASARVVRSLGPLPRRA